MEKLRIVVGGFIGLFPTGGATLDYIQYPLGLKMLGHDVYYIEDTNLYPVYQAYGKNWDDASDCIEYLRTTMKHFGFEDRWAYRDIASKKCFGMSIQKVKQVCSSADVFINISCSTFMREEYYNIPKRILIDSDPMFTQIQVSNEMAGETGCSTKSLLETHNYLFSFGENIGSNDCRIPTFDYKWIPTRQPVCLHLWESNSVTSGNSFTSIMNWSGRKKLLFASEEWGQKDVEFLKFLKVPLLSGSAFEVVINAPLNPESDFSKSEIESNNWNILDPKDTVSDYTQYMAFIKSSLAEFSIAKETYVKSNSGWFSCRSACYLAAGKPVVAQDTLWSKYLPTGEGLFAFTDINSAVESIRQVVSEPAIHAKAAKRIAHEYFDSTKVLTKMLNKLN
jgi:hypothetical protein